jgi:hypothetical protein
MRIAYRYALILYLLSAGLRWGTVHDAGSGNVLVTGGWGGVEMYE